MFFGDREGTITGYRQGLLDLTVSFVTPKGGMPPVTVKTNLTFYQEEMVFEVNVEPRLVSTITAGVNSLADPLGDQFYVEFRDVTTPRIEFLAPVSFPARGGAIAMVSVLSFPRLVDPNWDRVLHFQGPTEKFNVTIQGYVWLTEWNAGGAAVQTLTSLPAVSGFRTGLNAETESLYTTLLAKTELTLVQTTFDTAKAASETVILLFETPKVTEATAGPTSYSFSLTNTGNASDIWEPPVTLTNSKLTFFPAPTGSATSVLAQTPSGKPESGLSGNVQLMITLEGFDVVYKPSDIYVSFAETPIVVSRIITSTYTLTQFLVIVPPGEEGLKKVMVYPKGLKVNWAEFDFTYIDDRIPVVTLALPFQVYEVPQEEGSIMTAKLELLPVALRQDIRVDFLQDGLVFATRVPLTATYDFEGNAVITFNTPSGPVGTVSFIVSAGGKSSDPPKSFKYVKIPTTPPTIFFAGLASGGTGVPVTSNLGGTRLVIALNNMKRDVVENLRVKVTEKATGKVHSTISSASTFGDRLSITSDICPTDSCTGGTRVRFTMPDVSPDSGMHLFEIYSTLNASLSATAEIQVRDDTLPALQYVFPENVRADLGGLVIVSVKNLGTIAEGTSADPQSGHFTLAFEESTFTAVLVSAESSSSGDSGSVTILVSSNYATSDLFGTGHLTITHCIKCLCTALTACSKKVLSEVEVWFRDPTAPYIQYATPSEYFTDGKIPVTIMVENIPTWVQKEHVLVEFLTNATITRVDKVADSTLDPNAMDAEITVELPALADSETTVTLLPILRIPSQSGAEIITVPFPESFLYKPPPRPTIARFVPDKADMAVATAVRVYVNDFPGVLSKEDIVAYFVMDGQSHEEIATVEDYSPVDDSTDPNAIQDYIVDIRTPKQIKEVNTIKEGFASIIITHFNLARQSNPLSGFNFIDSSSPQVSSLSTEAGDVGVQLVRVRQSQATQLDLTIENARNSIAGVQVNKEPMFLTLNTGPDTLAFARARFPVPASTLDEAWGLVLFNAACGDKCTSDCCATGSCGTSEGLCTCRTSCFKLDYFDDLAPMVSFLKNAAGTEIGGNIISVTVKNLAQVSEASEIQVYFDKVYFATVLFGVMGYSTSLETAFFIVAPQIDLGGAASKQVAVDMVASSRPDQVVTFYYKVSEAIPKVDTFRPSQGPSTGGQKVLIKIANFPYPADVTVWFDGVALDATLVAVSQFSTVQLSEVVITTTKTGYGTCDNADATNNCDIQRDVAVRVIPKGFPATKTVSFTFKQLDTTLPIILAATPSEGPMVPQLGATSYILLDVFPTAWVGTLAGITITFTDLGGKQTKSLKASKVVKAKDGKATVTYVQPTFAVMGAAQCTIAITTTTKVKSATFNFVFYDQNAIRIMSVSAAAGLPTRGLIYGKSFDFAQSVDMTIANFPQQYTTKELVLTFDRGPTAVISKLEHTTCYTGSACNSTVVRFTSLAKDIAGKMPGVISASVGTTTRTLLSLSLTYFTPCALESYCSGSGLIVDTRKVAISPPTDALCRVSQCANPKLIPDPVMEFRPTKGPSTGGTVVTVDFQNFPGFAVADVTASVGAGAAVVYFAPTSVVNPGVTILENFGTMKLTMPSVPGGQTSLLSEVPVTLSVRLGTTTVSMSAVFLYTPVFQGVAELTDVPDGLFPLTTNTFRIRLTNVPRIADVTKVGQVLANFRGKKGIPAAAILKSTYTGTLVEFALEAGDPGIEEVSVYYSIHGLARAAVFDVTVLPQPQPKQIGLFPLLGRAGKDLILDVTMVYMDAKHLLTDMSATMTIPGDPPVDIAVVIEDLVSLAEPSCASIYCSLYSVKLVLVGSDEAIPRNGVTASIAINGGSDDKAVFVFVFEPDTTPTVVFTPKSMTLAEVDTVDIDVYLFNIPDINYCNVTSCFPEFDFGGVRRTGEILSRQFTGTRVIGALTSYEFYFQLRAPNSGKGGDVRVALGPLIGFDVTFTTPPAAPVPIDAPCAGGDSILVTAQGFGQEVKTPGDLTVTFDGRAATVTAIVSSVGTELLSETQFRVTTPLGMTKSELIEGVVIFKATVPVIATFVFECFDTPVAMVAPTGASLKGDTGTPDGTAIISLINFPDISSARDIQVSFGTDLVCDGGACSVLSVNPSSAGYDIEVTVPPSASVRTVALRVLYVGPVKVPWGGDLAGTYVRYAVSPIVDFNFFIPLPVIQLAWYCEACNTGKACIVDERCGADEAPAINSIAKSAHGSLSTQRAKRLTLRVSNMPVVVFADGKVDSSSSVTIQFGGEYGQILQILQSDEDALMLEVQLTDELEQGNVMALLEVRSDVSVPIPSAIEFPVRVFDDNIQLLCESPGCIGNARTAKKLKVNVTNTFVAAESFQELIYFSFGDLAPQAVSVVSVSDEVSIFSMTPPTWTCPSCVTSGGKATVTLSVRYVANNAVIASSLFTFWAPPAVADLRFASTGTVILLTFDQDTDRASMVGNSPCTALIANAGVLGAGATCVWQSPRLVKISLSSDATVNPFDSLTVSATAGPSFKGVRSINLISSASSASGVVSEPLIKIPPAVTVKGASVVDPCGDLELICSVASPRPPSYFWECLNDVTLNKFLSVQSLATLRLNSGTKEMATLDKSYEIRVTVTDFLGSTNVAVQEVFKKSSASPLLQFSPVSLATTRDKEILIKGETVFSSCPIETGQLSYKWRKVSGGAFPAKYFATPASGIVLPQLQVAPNELVAGSTYELALRVQLGTDASQSSEAFFVLSIGYQDLIPRISGGAKVQASASMALALSGAESLDPDLLSTVDQGLSYAWGCSRTSTSGIVSRCRNATDDLPISLPSTKVIDIRADSLLASSIPYTFTLTVSKAGRSPATSTKLVEVLSGVIPTLGMAVTGELKRKKDGYIYINAGTRLTVDATANFVNMTWGWQLDPFVDLTATAVAPLGFVSSKLILQGGDVLIAGGKYTLVLTGTIIGGLGAVTSLALEINAPPLGGRLKVCLDGSNCLQTGEPVIDDFNFDASGFNDADFPLKYLFGYAIEGGNGTVTQWNDAITDSFVKLPLPQGSVTCMARVIDFYGASTPILYDAVTVTPAATRRRSLLNSAMAFLAKANAKMDNALGTFRPDKVNRLAGSLAGSLSGQSAEDAVNQKAKLMSMMTSGVSKGVRTNGYACETFSASNAVSSDTSAGAVSKSGISNTAALMKTMMAGASGSIDSACAASAIGTMGNSGSALAAFGKKKKPMDPPALDPAQGLVFMKSLAEDLKKVMSQAVWDKVAGEPGVNVATSGAVHTMTRVKAKDLNTKKVDVASPANSQLRRGAIVVLPDIFAAEIFGDESSETEVDMHVHTDAFGYAPTGFSLKSPLVSLSVSARQTTNNIPVFNLTKAIEVTIPIDLSQLPTSEISTFPQKAQCVWWTNTTYSPSGCSIKPGGIQPNYVTCLCTHLTSFAINYLGDLPACGDSKQQTPYEEECDDGNIYDGDGCSSECKIEPTFACSGSENTKSKCVSDFVQTPLSDSGTVATLALSGFTSKLDFMAKSDSFKSSVSSSIGQGTASEDIVIISVSFEGDFSEYARRRALTINTFDHQQGEWAPILPYEVFEDMSTDAEREAAFKGLEEYGARFRIGAGEEHGARFRIDHQSIDHEPEPSRRLLAEKLVKVNFQVNTPEGVAIASILQGLNSPSFLSSVASVMGTAIGRTLVVSFSESPYVVTASGDPLSSDKPGSAFEQSAFGASGGTDQLFLDAPNSILGLDPTLFGIIAGLTVGGMVSFFCLFIVVPRYVRSMHARNQERPKSADGEKKVHHNPWAQLVGRAMPWTVDEVEEDEVVRMSHVGQAGSTEDVIELPPAPPARESRDNAAGTGLPPVRPGGRFGHARARLHDLQSQLDVILGTLPTRESLPGGAGGDTLSGGALGPTVAAGITDSRRKLPALSVAHPGGNTLNLSDMTPSPEGRRAGAAGQMWGGDAGQGTDQLQAGSVRRVRMPAGAVGGRQTSVMGAATNEVQDESAGGGPPLSRSRRPGSLVVRRAPNLRDDANAEFSLQIPGGVVPPPPPVRDDGRPAPMEVNAPLVTRAESGAPPTQEPGNQSISLEDLEEPGAGPSVSGPG